MKQKLIHTLLITVISLGAITPLAFSDTDATKAPELSSILKQLGTFSLATSKKAVNLGVAASVATGKGIKRGAIAGYDMFKSLPDSVQSVLLVATGALGGAATLLCYQKATGNFPAVWNIGRLGGVDDLPPPPPGF